MLFDNNIITNKINKENNCSETHNQINITIYSYIIVNHPFFNEMQNTVIQHFEIYSKMTRNIKNEQEIK